MRAGYRACVVESLEGRRLFVTDVGVSPLIDTISYTDSDGTHGTIRVRGATGSLAFLADLVPMQKGRKVTLPTATDLQSVTLAPAAAGGTIQFISIRGKGGDGVLSLPQTNINGPLGLFGAKSAHLQGPLTIAGACGRFQLGDAADDSTITFREGVQEVRVVSDCFADVTINGNRAIDSVTRIIIGSSVRGIWDVDVPVGFVSADEFEDDWDGEFDDVGSFRSRGDFLGDIDGRSFRGFYVGGRMSGVNFGLLDELEGDDDYALEFLRVKKEIDGVVISSIRSLGDIRAGGIQNSLFFAGINAAGLSAENRIPNSPHNFERNSQVRSITISARSSVGFSDTVIAAMEIGNLRLGRVSADNGGRPFGFGATQVRSASGTLFGSGPDQRFQFTLLTPVNAGNFSALASSEGLEPGDFTFTLVPRM